MLTIFNLENCEMASYDEKDFFIVELNKLIETGKFNYLKTININSITLYWNKEMNSDNGIIGAFTHIHPTFIFLMYAPLAMELLIDTVVHELRHMYQYNCCVNLFKIIFGDTKVSRILGFGLYTILAIPIIREFTLEYSADHYTELVKKYK